MLLTNINWGKNLEGIRKLELGDFYSTNMNIWYKHDISSPIDASINRVQNNKINLFFVRKRFIYLMDLWNRIIASGLFLEKTVLNEVGGNLRNNVGEYLTKGWTSNSTYNYPVDLSIGNINSKILKFIAAVCRVYNRFENGTNSFTSNKNEFSSISYSSGERFYVLINGDFDVRETNFINLMLEMLNLWKSLIDESKLISELGLTFNDLNFVNETNRLNIINNFNNIITNLDNLAKTDESFLSENIKPTNKKLVQKQFGCELFKNIENEDWNVYHAIVDVSNFDFNDPEEINNYSNRSKILCTKLEMDRPLKLEYPQFINWEDDMDKPFIMLYCGAVQFGRPDEYKSSINEPDIQRYFKGNFWSIGTANTNDINYKKLDDIKLNLSHPINELNKLDYLDNLSIYLKLD